MPFCHWVWKEHTRYLYFQVCIFKYWTIQTFVPACVSHVQENTCLGLGYWNLVFWSLAFRLWAFVFWVLELWAFQYWVFGFGLWTSVCELQSFGFSVSTSVWACGDWVSGAWVFGFYAGDLGADWTFSVSWIHCPNRAILRNISRQSFGVVGGGVDDRGFPKIKYLFRPPPPGNRLWHYQFSGFRNLTKCYPRVSLAG